MAIDAALRPRAHAMLAAMSVRGRWIYALPRRADTAARLGALLGEAGLSATRAEGEVGQWDDPRGAARFVVYDAAALGVVLVEATGAAAPAPLARALERLGFVPQTELWARALELVTPEARRALRLLAHMTVQWDEAWTDVFLLHLASPDPVTRCDAATSVVIAALVAGDRGPACTLLRHAQALEKLPKLAAFMGDALRSLTHCATGPCGTTAESPLATRSAGAFG
ncbi:MAG: hypothetical protein IT373_13050 [Polyangiaceae bacterium]|nr:hypothetical protein [Polyangiaceae bacterium]